MVMNKESRVDIEETLNQALNLAELLQGTIHPDILAYQLHLDVCLENIAMLFLSLDKQPSTEPLYRLAEDYKEGATLL